MNKTIGDSKELEQVLKNADKAIILFYASWCPFSRKFLPVYEKMCAGKPGNYHKCLLDDDEKIAEKYSIDVYPTVLFFENGKVTNRLDGISGQGLNEKLLTDFIGKCKV